MILSIDMIYYCLLFISITADFDSLKEEAICCNFLNDQCIDGPSCSLLHPDPKLPYLWQYYFGGVWKKFPLEYNLEVEKCFSDPSFDSFE